VISIIQNAYSNQETLCLKTALSSWYSPLYLICKKQQKFTTDSCSSYFTHWSQLERRLSWSKQKNFKGSSTPFKRMNFNYYWGDTLKNEKIQGDHEMWDYLSEFTQVLERVLWLDMLRAEKKPGCGMLPS
jgi:hypothetical protein